MDDIKRNLGRKKQEVRSDCMLHRQSIIVTIAEILQVIFYLYCFGYITGLFAEGSFMYKHPTYTVSLITIILETLLLASAGFTIGLMNKSKVSFFVICALDIIELVLILVICSELYKRHANIKVINNVYRDALMYGKLAKDSFQLISTSILIPIHIIGMRAVLMLKKNGRSAWKQLQ